MPTAFFFLAYGFFSSFNLEKSYSLLIEAHLLSSRLTSRNNPDHGIVFLVTVNYDKRSRACKSNLSCQPARAAKRRAVLGSEDRRAILFSAT